MDIRPVDDSIAVAPQLQPEDMVALAAQGYTAVICNRPDGEDPGQPGVAEMRAAAEAVGLAFHHIPVSGGQCPEAAVAAFRAVRKGTPGKVLAYCRTGTRCMTLDTLAKADETTADVLIDRAAKAGYDLSAMRDRLIGQD